MKLRQLGKKADLSLSINTIVILILAITVMGLGLTFIRGLFKGAQEKLGGALQATELDNPPTAEKPITIDAQVEVSINEERTLKIGIYNPGTGTTDGMRAVSPVLSNCIHISTPGVNVAATDFLLASPAQDIAPRGIGAYAAVLKYTGTKTGTFICTVIAGGTGATIPSTITKPSAHFYVIVK